MQRIKKRANELDGKSWTRFSVSIWNDIRKSKDELIVNHPAMYPVMLVERLIDCFMSKDDNLVLDPFMGSGATLIAAKNKNKNAIGFEVSKEYIKLAKLRLKQSNLFNSGEIKIFEKDARLMKDEIKKNSIDLCITSPPYWDILSQKRSADNKAIKDYIKNEKNLSEIKDYNDFLRELMIVFRNVHNALKPNKYFIINVMDIRKKDKFYSFHSDIVNMMVKEGYIYDDLIIWDRSKEYNNLRPLGYPSVFRINKVHEFILIFKKCK